MNQENSVSDNVGGLYSELNNYNFNSTLDSTFVDGIDINTSNVETPSSDEGTYSQLRDDINSGGNLTKKYYHYNTCDGDTIKINTRGVINGNGAVIDMTGSNMRALYVGVSGVTINNLTIKNANYNGNGAAIYINGSGTVTNCNFTNNSARCDGGAIRFGGEGNVRNCNFNNNTGLKKVVLFI